MINRINTVGFNSSGILPLPAAVFNKGHTNQTAGLPGGKQAKDRKPCGSNGAIPMHYYTRKNKRTTSDVPKRLDIYSFQNLFLASFCDPLAISFNHPLQHAQYMCVTTNATNQEIRC
jgi:hypothetical protein